MKTLVLFLIFTTLSFAQQDTTFRKVANKPTERITEYGSVTFTKTLNSVQFSRYVDAEIKQKITRFMKTNRKGYTELGTYTLRLVKRKGNLYIKEQTLPEKLILLN